MSKARYARTIALSLLLSSAPWTLHGQSTSSWIRLDVPAAPVAGAVDQDTPQLGASYLTVQFVSARINQNSNWWTALVEKNRRAVVDVTVSGDFGTAGKFSDVRTSDPIEIHKSAGDLDISFAPILLDKLPSTYKSLEVKVRISKSAQDGLDALLNTVAQLSANTPMQVTPSALNAASAVKAIADFMFDKQLLQEKLKSRLGFPNSGQCFASRLLRVLRRGRR